MNNKRIGKFAVTAIVGVLSAISGIVGVEMMKSVKKDIEKTEKERRSVNDNLYSWQRAGTVPILEAISAQDMTRLALLN